MDDNPEKILARIRGIGEEIAAIQEHHRVLAVEDSAPLRAERAGLVRKLREEFHLGLGKIATGLGGISRTRVQQFERGE